MLAVSLQLPVRMCGTVRGKGGRKTDVLTLLRVQAWLCVVVADREGGVRVRTGQAIVGCAVVRVWTGGEPVWGVQSSASLQS